MIQEGFFDIPKVSKAKKKLRGCSTCGLYRTVLSPKMEPYGKFYLNVLNVGEAPGQTEDKRGRQWQGRVGQLLQDTYKDLGYDLFRDCINTNSANCRPIDKKGNNRAPTPQEIACCRQRLLKVIEEYKPKVIMLYGQSALNSLIAPRWKHDDFGTISRWRGWTIPDRDFNAWICPTYHPSYLARGEKEIEVIWKKDIEKGLALHKTKFPKFEDEEKQVVFLKEEELGYLENIGSPFAFDYETTGLKPYNKEVHHIVCMSVADKDNCYAFMIPKADTKGALFIKRLLRSDRGKIASNMKFEDTWTRIIFGYSVNNWEWDTMLCAHVLDNRPAISGLKFQTYVNFGLADYDSEVAPYLKSAEKKNANAPNKIDQLIATEAGKKKLMTYCGMDSILEYKLAIKQMRELNDGKRVQEST